MYPCICSAERIETFSRLRVFVEIGLNSLPENQACQ